MRRSSSIVLVSAFTVVMAVGADLRAEPSATSVKDDPKLSSQRRVVHPPPSPEIAEQDAEYGAVQIEQRERDDELVRKELRGPERRPDLDHDVVQGIQSRNVDSALRRQ